MTWTCPKCGKIFTNEIDYQRHNCNYWEKDTRKCIHCNGTGIITGGIFEPNRTCPYCHGSGRG